MSAKIAALVERPEVLSIECQDDPILGHRDSKHFRVALPIARLLCVECSYEFHVVTEATKPILYPRRELLVGQESGHPQSFSFSRI